MKASHARMKRFEELIQQHYQYLQRFIYSLSRKDPDATEEIFQCAMVNCIEHLHQLRDESKMKSWIFAIVKEEATRYYSRKKPISFIDFSNEESFSIQDRSKETNFVVDVENKDLILQILTHFDPIHQQIFVLHYYYGITFPEIANILNMNLNTVRSIHLRGLAKMRTTTEIMSLRQEEQC